MSFDVETSKFEANVGDALFSSRAILQLLDIQQDAHGPMVVFNYGNGHTVDEVSESDYNSCTVGNPISTNNNGSTNVSLNAVGTHYYICGIIGHCGSGMKLAVTATAGGGSVAEPFGSPPPTGTTTTTPSPPTTFTEPPSSVPAPSSSGVLSPFVAMMCTWVSLYKFVVIE